MRCTSGSEIAEALHRRGAAQALGILHSVLSHVDELNPSPNGEDVAVALDSPRTAALFFDRVWAGLDASIPSEIGYWGGSDAESRFLVAFGEMLENEASKGTVLPRPQRPAAIRLALQDGGDVAKIGLLCRTLAEKISEERRRSAVPVYNSAERRSAEFQPGDRAAIVAILENIPVVDERSLSWQQVRHFRSDPAARAALTRFVHWLDGAMAGKSRAFVEDEIATRLDAYQFALRKHGVVSIAGVLSATLDSKVLLGGPAAVAALSYAGSPGWALAAGGAIVVGRATLHIVQELLSFRELRDRSEIAFVAQLTGV